MTFENGLLDFLVAFSGCEVNCVPPVPDEYESLGYVIRRAVVPFAEPDARAAAGARDVDEAVAGADVLALCFVCVCVACVVVSSASARFELLDAGSFTKALQSQSMSRNDHGGEMTTQQVAARLTCH